MADLTAPGFYVAVASSRSGGEERAPPERLISLAFEDLEAKADKVVVVVDNYDLTQLDSSLWQPGNILTFQFGYPGAMSPRRRMKIQTVKGFSQLTVEAHGEESEMNKVLGDGTERWENVTRADVVRDIARRYGFRDEELHVADTTLTIPQVTKAVLTDLQLIRSLAEREGFEFYVDYDGLHFHPQNTSQPPVREWTYFIDQGRGDIESIAVDDDRAPGKPGAFKMVGRDPRTKETFVVAGDDSTTQRTALAPRRTTFAPYEDDAPATGGQLWTKPTTELTKAAAERSAQGTQRRQQMRAMNLTLGMRGDALLLAKTIVRINGLGPTLSGMYYVTEVKHGPLSASGYRMTVKVKRDGTGGPKVAGAGGKGKLPATTAATSAKTNTSSSPASTTSMMEVHVVDKFGKFTGEVKLVPSGGRSSGT